MKTIRTMIALLVVAVLLLPTEAQADGKRRSGRSRHYHHYYGYGPGYGYGPYWGGYYGPYYDPYYGPYAYGPGPVVYADPGVAAGAAFGGLLGAAIANS
jgi:hypothetical protein